jgi:hypothetical protein
MIYHAQPKNTLQPLPTNVQPNISGNTNATVPASSTILAQEKESTTSTANPPLYRPAPNSSFSQNLQPHSGLSSEQLLLGGGAIVILLIAFLIIKRKYFPNEF